MMENYIKALLAQIRCQKAHPMIEEEFRTHIQEQILENVQNGMEQVEAEKHAVHDMGDPIAVGSSLDRIHRPSISISLLIFMAVITVLGNVIHILALEDVADKWSFLRISILGYLVMCGTYFLDYTFFAKHAKKIGIVLLLMLFGIQISDLAIPINGARSYLSFGPFRIALVQWMILYVPCYAAILYHNRSKKVVGIIQSFLYAFIPSYLVLHMSGTMYAIIMFFTMSVLLTISVSKGWFLISKRKFYIAYWGGVLLVISGILYRMMFGQGYQASRIKGLFHRSEDVNYIANLLSDLLKHSNFLGSSGQIINNILPEANKDYILTNLMTRIGILPGILLCILFTFFYMKLFRMAAVQKNELGMLISISCGLLLSIQFLLNAGSNFAIISATFETNLPFISTGNQSTIVSYCLIGMILSTYKYKSVLPKQIALRQTAEKA